MRFRTAALTAALLLLSSGAWAACSGPASITDSSSTTRNYDLAAGSAGNCANEQSVVNLGAQKAASTQAVAADQSTVVQLNPNQPNLTTPLNVAVTQIGSSAVVGDPCQIQTPTSTPISMTSATTSDIIPGTTSKKTYICSIALFAGTADNVAVIEGTGATCTGSTAGVIGGTTAANGLNFAANGHIELGAGVAYVAATATAADNLCFITSSSGPLAGVVKWVQQ